MKKKQHELALLFLKKAAEDEALLDEGLASTKISDSIFAFHAQQAVEKLLKSLLCGLGVRFGKTHDILELMDLLSDARKPVPPTFAQLDTLTPYGTLGRYDDLPIDSSFDRQSFRQQIQELRQWVEAQLAI